MFYSICKDDNVNDKKCLPRCGIVDRQEFGSCEDKYDCCSKDGYCGTSKEFFYSSNGCQPEFGVCRCGEGMGSCSEDDGYCCSQKGYCGTTNAFCSIDNGCQSGFGHCNEEVNTCTYVKGNLGINDENKDKFKCEENDQGLAKLM